MNFRIMLPAHHLTKLTSSSLPPHKTVCNNNKLNSSILYNNLLQNGHHFDLDDFRPFSVAGLSERNGQMGPKCPY